MKVYRGFNDPALKRARRSVAIGVFDGVHRGHKKILRLAQTEARLLRARSIVVTFDPHPGRILQGPAKSPNLLLSLRHRLKIFEDAGLSEALVIPFTRRFSRIPREKFLDKFLIGRLGMRALSVGEDFRFGRLASGDTRFLRTAAAARGFKLHCVKPLKEGGRIISSTHLRRLIEAGRLKEASRMLGREVSVYGTVVRGQGRGRRIGFPTANLNPHHEVLPPAGVYAAFGYWKSRRLSGVVHIGHRPTFGEKEKTLEIHFLNFRGDLYGQEIELIFVKRLRGIRRFKSGSDLSRAIRRDILAAGRVL